MSKRFLAIILICIFAFIPLEAFAIKYKGDLETNESVTFPEQGSTPANPAATKYKLYFKSDGNVYKLNSSGTEAQVDGGGGGSGDVVGPASSTDNAIVRFDLATGKLIQDSGATLSDTGELITDGPVGVGDPGTEDSGVPVNGVTFDSAFKVNDLGGTEPAQAVIHRHSTTLQAVLMGTRSKSNDDTHSALTNGDTAFSIFGGYWTGTHYDLSGSIDFEVPASGTVSSTSAPGDIVFKTSPDGTDTPAEALRIGSEGVVTLNDFEFATENSAGKLTFIGESSTDPTVPAANNGILYTKDDGAETKLYFRSTTGITDLLAGGGGSGDVVGPASSTDNAIVRFDSTTGKLVQDTPLTTISDTGQLALTGVGASIDIVERAAAPTPAAGRGYFWIKSDTPSTAYFTDDAGTDFQLGAGGGLWQDDGAYTNLISKATDGVGVGPGTADDGLLHVVSGTPGAQTANVNGDEIVIEGAGQAGLSIISGTAGNLFFGDTGSALASKIVYTHSTNVLSFWTNGNALDDNLALSGSGAVFNEGASSVFDFRIESLNNTNMFFLDASGNRIGIGNTLPTDGLLHISEGNSSSAADGGADLLVLEDNLSAGMSILSPATQEGRIYFGSSVSNKDGRIVYSHVSDQLVFGVENTDILKMNTENSGGGLTFTGESSADHTTPAANNGVIYTKDVGAETHLMFRNTTEVTDLLAPKVGVLHSDGTASATTAVTTEETLMTYTLPANTLSANGKGVRISVAFLGAANTNSKRYRLYFGGTVVKDITSTTTSFIMQFEANIVRTGVGTQQTYSPSIGFDTDTGAIVLYGLPTEDETGSIEIKLTGQNGVASAGDITANHLMVELF